MGRHAYQLLLHVLVTLSLSMMPSSAFAFVRVVVDHKKSVSTTTTARTTQLAAVSKINSISSSVSTMDRRNMFTTTAATLLGGVIVGTTSMLPTSPAFAIATPSLEDYLYRVIRVREATYQERRLIQSGKFKDMQRANVKLAVRFMVQNYRLSDAIVGASAYLKGGNAANMKAMDVGQSAVQSLLTILEYFDSGDVENIKVGSSKSSLTSSSGMAGKEALVMKGLESASDRLDAFLSLFPEETITTVKARIQKENELNVKEFDPTLGDIINLPSAADSVKLKL